LSARTLAIAASFALDRDLRGHAAHGEGAAPVRGLDEEPRVRAQEVRRHRHLAAVGQHEVRVAAELLDEREDVVPAAAVEAHDVVAQLPEDLVHLERGEDGLDQHRDLDGLRRQPETRLGVAKHLGPQPRLEVALGLRQVEVRSRAAAPELGLVVEQVQPEVHEGARYRLAVDEQVLLVEMPAARAHDQGGDGGIQAVGLALRAGEIDAPRDGIAQVDLALDHVVPGRRHRVLAVGHEHLRAGVQRVDDHLAIGRAGDLDPAILQVGRDRGDVPLALADGVRLRQEVRPLSGVDPLLPLHAPL
jgi:hypothetical protein